MTQYPRRPAGGRGRENTCTRATGAVCRVALAVVLIVAILGCGGPLKKEGEPIRVAAAETVEQLILGKMTVILLRSHGYKVIDKTDLGEPWMVRAALEAGSVDVCWEYTENTYVLYLEHDHPIVDPVWLYDEVVRDDARHRITWLAMAPAQHTLSLVVRPEMAQQYDLHTIADLSAHVSGYKPQTSLCVPQALYTPASGIRGLERVYGFRFNENQIRYETMDDTLAVLAKKGCDCALSADAAEVVSRDLVALEDTAGFFRASNLAVAVRATVLLAYPDLEEPLRQVAAALDAEALATLRYEVEERGQDPEKVARRFLSKHELIKNRWLPPTRTPTAEPTEPVTPNPYPDIDPTPEPTVDVRQ